MLKKILIFGVFLFSCYLDTFSIEDPYHGYYNNALGKKGDELKNAIFEIIKNNTFIEYSDLWTYFSLTDNKGGGIVWDIYSDVPDSVPPYEFSFSSNQCGNYNSEGDCFNREHSVPNSWFGGDPMKQYHIYSDLCHLYPTDGFVNNKRNNMPYGIVNSPNWTSQNGSKIGPNCYSADYTGDVFEPIDAYKGDLARTYFYMSLRYKDFNIGQESVSMFNYSTLKPWALSLFREWNQNDEVSKKEQDRNNAIQMVQNNRNPFIDFPQLVEYLWGDSTEYVFQPYIATSVNDYPSVKSYSVYPNPANGKFHIANPEMQINEITVLNELGQIVAYSANVSDTTISFDISYLKSGFYFIKIKDTKHTETIKLIVQ